MIQELILYFVESRINRNKKNAWILFEFLIGLSVLSVLLGVFMQFVFTEIKENQNYSIETEKSQQIIFAQNYLQSIANSATDILLISQTLQINAGTKIYTVGLRNNELYVKQTAYRYLTTSPFKIDSLDIEEINNKLFKLKLRSGSKRYEILIKKDP